MEKNDYKPLNVIRNEGKVLTNIILFVANRDGLYTSTFLVAEVVYVAIANLLQPRFFRARSADHHRC